MIVESPASTLEEIQDEHEQFQGSLRAAADAVSALRENPWNRSARRQARQAWRFICAHALPHMRYEEEVIFARAQARGAPEAMLFVLRGEHEQLRNVAARLKALEVGEEADFVPPETAELLRTFVHLFEWHIAREEELAGELGERPATTRAA